MVTKTLGILAGRSIAYGGIAGVVASLIMTPVLTTTGMVSEMPATSIPHIINLMFGTSMENPIIIGLIMRILAGTIIGVIFGAIVGSVRQLRIMGFGKGIALGIATGMIAFAALDQPQIMAMSQQPMPVLMVAGIVSHLIYGAVLGGVASILVLRNKHSP